MRISRLHFILRIEMNMILSNYYKYCVCVQFREYKDKIDIVDDKEEDTMEYDYRNTYVYRPEMNGPGLTGDEIVTIPHPLILGMALAINVDREELIPFIRAAINGLLHNPKDIFVNISSAIESHFVNNNAFSID